MSKPFEEGEDYYYNADGFFVLTKEYLLARGYCCGNGCKNCPYDYKNVPEPKRSEYIKKRADEKQSD
jgi:hypothetical protein